MFLAAIKQQTLTFLTSLSESNPFDGTELALSDNYVVFKKTGRVKVFVNLFKGKATGNQNLENISKGVLQAITDGEDVLFRTFTPEQLNAIIQNLGTARDKLKSKTSGDTVTNIDTFFQSALDKINTIKQRRTPRNQQSLSYISYITTPLSYVTIKPLFVTCRALSYLVPKKSTVVSLSKRTWSGCVQVYNWATSRRNQATAVAPQQNVPSDLARLRENERAKEAYLAELVNSNDSHILPLLDDLKFAIGLTSQSLKKRGEDLDTALTSQKQNVNRLKADGLAFKKKVTAVDLTSLPKNAVELAKLGIEKYTEELGARERQVKETLALFSSKKEAFKEQAAEFNEARKELTIRIKAIKKFLADPASRSKAQLQLGDFYDRLSKFQDKFDPLVFKMLESSAKTIYETLAIESQIRQLDPALIPAAFAQTQSSKQPSKQEIALRNSAKIPSLIDDILFTLIQLTPRWLAKGEADLSLTQQNLIREHSTLKLYILSQKRETERIASGLQVLSTAAKESIAKKCEEIAQRQAALNAADGEIKSKTATFEKDRAKYSALSEELVKQLREMKMLLLDPREREKVNVKAAEFLTCLAAGQPFLDKETFEMMKKVAVAIHVNLSSP